MKVLALTKYDRLAASSRHRFLAYAPSLARMGIQLDLSPLFGDGYLKAKFQRGATEWSSVMQAYGRRLVALLRSRRWDLLWIHCEAFPYMPPWAELALKALGIRYVFDYDDAIFHMYDRHRSRAVRALLGGKLETIIRGARAVTAGSRYLADYADRFSSTVHHVPTVVDLARYPTRAVAPTNRPYTVGWIGSPSTSEYLDIVAPALQRMAQTEPVRLMLIGSPPRTIPGIEVDVRRWSESSEVSDLMACDVGIMPLPDEPWARGKCAFKLIQYMACGLATVSSPVGANSEVVREDTGILAETTEQWVAALSRLRDDVELRVRMGQRGRERVETQYSLESQSDRVGQILRTAAV